MLPGSGSWDPSPELKIQVSGPGLRGLWEGPLPGAGGWGGRPASPATTWPDTPTETTAWPAPTAQGPFGGVRGDLGPLKKPGASRVWGPASTQGKSSPGQPQTPWPGHTPTGHLEMCGGQGAPALLSRKPDSQEAGPGGQRELVAATCPLSWGSRTEESDPSWATGSKGAGGGGLL